MGNASNHNGLVKVNPFLFMCVAIIETHECRVIFVIIMTFSILI